MQGKDFVTPDNIQNVIKDVLRHRIALSYKARAEGIAVDKVIDKIVEVVAVLA
jgi:MoxR-like ATPase